MPTAQQCSVSAAQQTNGKYTLIEIFQILKHLRLQLAITAAFGLCSAYAAIIFASVNANGEHTANM
jgi:hypothetical protein